MNTMVVGFSVMVIIFLLVILLGLQIQITSLTSRIDEVIDKLSSSDKES